jgi:uncharacterized membrane protein YeaQ/YmgE (transglycosylase-associated protein family)
LELARAFSRDGDLFALSPALSFSLLLATLCGALVHLIFGGDGGQLLTDVLASWAGFAIGQAVGDVFGIVVGSIGPVHIAIATTGALLAIAVARLLMPRR